MNAWWGRGGLNVKVLEQYAKNPRRCGAIGLTMMALY